MNIQDGVENPRQTLRKGTHGEHVRLNQHPMLEGLTRPGYPRARLGFLLSGYFHIYRALELAITSLPVDGFSYASRQKLPWLIQDLEHFGIDPESTGYRPYGPLATPAPIDAAELAGMLYTIEGSTMGGQVISRHLATHLGITPAMGCRFFHAYGEHTATRWNEFEAFLNASLADRQQCERALATAKATFGCIETILDEYHARSE